MIPVTKIYAQSFREIEDLPFEDEIAKASLGEESEWRAVHNVPPGYKDKGKENSNGDFLIWKTLLEIAHRYKKAYFLQQESKKRIG
jgi:hypothetical protein